MTSTAPGPGMCTTRPATSPDWRQALAGHRTTRTFGEIEPWAVRSSTWPRMLPELPAAPGPDGARRPEDQQHPVRADGTDRPIWPWSTSTPCPGCRCRWSSATRSVPGAIRPARTAGGGGILAGAVPGRRCRLRPGAGGWITPAEVVGHRPGDTHHLRRAGGALLRRRVARELLRLGSRPLPEPERATTRCGRRASSRRPAPCGQSGCPRTRPCAARSCRAM
jgi:hypothetical protein